MSLYRVIAHRLYTSHHLLLRDQMINPLQQAQKTLHTPAPLVQNLIRIASLGERNDSGGAVDFGIDRLGRHELTDVALRLLLVQIEQLGESVHLDARVVFRNDADVVFDDALAEVLPAGVGFWIFLV